jgi:hypothetical protein
MKAVVFSGPRSVLRFRRGNSAAPRGLIAKGGWTGRCGGVKPPAHCGSSFAHGLNWLEEKTDAESDVEETSLRA